MVRQHRRKKRTYVIAGVCVIACLLGIAGGFAIAANNDNDDFSLTPESVHVKDSQIENSTLVIGSHLIYVGSMTDELYQIASDSANTFSQQDLYYKSELSGGTWYEITTATSIADISTSGSPVPKSVIEELEFTHYTKSDGRTYDLVTGKEVNIFNISDPYDIDAMEELQPVIVQYERIKNKNTKSKVDEEDLTLLEEFFNEDLKSVKYEVPQETLTDMGIDITLGIEQKADAEVALYEKGLESLQQYYNSLKPNDSEADKREITSMVMGKLDATRRLYVLAKLYDLLDDLENDVLDSTKEAGDAASVDTELSDAVIEAQCNVQSSLITYSAKALTDGTTVIGKEEYSLITQLINDAKENSSDCDTTVSRIADLYNIRDNIIDKKAQELAYLDSTLIPAAENAYKAALSTGESEKYKDISASGGTQTALDQCLEESKSTINAVRVEYQFLISAKVRRMDEEAAKNYVMGLLDGVDALRAGIPRDAQEAVANETVDQFEQWIRETLAGIVNSGTDGSDIGRLRDEKDALLAQQQQALDDNDMAEYNRLQALIDEKDQMLEDSEKDLVAVITSGSSTDAEKVVAAAKLGSKSAAATALSIADSVVAEIQGGEFDGLDSALSSLEALMESNSEVAVAALDRIKDALDSASDSALSESQMDGYMDSMRDLISKGKEKANGNGLSPTELENCIEDVYGAPFMSLEEDQQLQIVLAIEWYGEMKSNKKIKELAGTYADLMKNNGSRYVYDKLASRTSEYVSTKALAECLGYRYVFDDARTEVTLQRRTQYYTFLANSVHVRTTDDTEILSARAEYQTYVYIPVDYVNDVFEYQAEYIDSSSVALLYGADQQKNAQEFYQMLMKKGGS